MRGRWEEGGWMMRGRREEGGKKLSAAMVMALEPQRGKTSLPWG